jgi:RNA polymerase sigma factor (sigma-70 family)
MKVVDGSEGSGATREERALVAAVLDGAPGAFERLVVTYQGLVWHVVLRMVRHPEDARELCQEAFLRVHRCLHQYRFDAALKSWIAQVAYSLARRHLERKRIPLAEPGADANGLSLVENVDDGFDLETSASDAQRDALLHAAIDRLPPLQRTLLTLYHLDDMAIPDISRITGLAEGTIKSHLFRSRKQLRAILTPKIGVAA